jgi:hypothetical protein
LVAHLHEACERVVAVAQNAQGAESTSAPGEQG